MLKTLIYYVRRGDGRNVNHMQGDETNHSTLITHSYLKQTVVLREDRYRHFAVNKVQDAVGGVVCESDILQTHRVHCQNIDSKSELFLSVLIVWHFMFQKQAPTGTWAKSCQGNIRGVEFRPWQTECFLASFNFIMKAWTATNSRIGTCEGSTRYCHTATNTNAPLALPI